MRLAEKLGEDPVGGGGGVRPSPRVVDRVGAGVAMAGTADADRASTPEVVSGQVFLEGRTTHTYRLQPLGGGCT